MRKLFIIFEGSIYFNLENLGVDNMKEYKVVFIKLGINPDKSADKVEKVLNEMAGKGIRVSHILKAIEDNPSQHDFYNIWLGNSMNTPEPINTKKDLIEILTT